MLKAGRLGEGYARTKTQHFPFIFSETPLYPHDTAAAVVNALGVNFCCRLPWCLNLSSTQLLVPIVHVTLRLPIMCFVI